MIIRVHKLQLFVFILSQVGIAQTVVLDSISKFPVSYATISFGDGQGVFADDEGKFFFTKKLYPDVDSLFITALGFKPLNVATSNLPRTLFLQPQADELDEVVLTTNLKRKFKEERLKPYLDDDYYKCWLPTIESEIAVFFPKTIPNEQQLKEIHFPIALESKNWKKRKRSNSDKKSFSTLFKVNIYENSNGLPGPPLTIETIVFRVTEKDGDNLSLNVENYDVYIPENGLFISLQVMGYTDKNGKLLPSKKYKEIKTVEGVVKIPTNFRPLLPFTDKIENKNTYIRRVFNNGNSWLKFDKGNGIKSSLIDKGLFNYGIGLTLKTYKEK